MDSKTLLLLGGLGLGALALGGGRRRPTVPDLPANAWHRYGWYPGHWDSPHPYTPTMGLYSAVNRTVMAQHTAWAKYANITVSIDSWWGPGDNFGTDAAVQAYLAYLDSAGSPIKCCVYYELEQFHTHSAADIAQALEYLRAHMFGHASYKRVNGAPVVFVYNAQSPDRIAVWADAKRRYQQAHPGESIYLQQQVYGDRSVWTNDPNGPSVDGWHNYDPAGSYLNLAAAPSSGSASPGFWNPSLGAPKLERSLAGFDAAVAQLAAANLQWRIITTLSEHGEGTVVEPTAEFGSAYLDVLHNRLPRLA